MKITLEWVDAKERMPDVKEGECGEFIVTAQSKSGKRFCFSAVYLNKMILCPENACEWETEEGTAFTGWHELKTHYCYDDFYIPFDSDQIVTHWMALPDPVMEDQP